MTHHEENTAIGQMLEAVIEDGMEGLEAAITIWLNEASLLRLVSAILMEISEDWETGRVCLKPEEDDRTA
ncbi:MAG: hypothetical protein JRJ72_12470 [Deltaproteobacteria bacterium]|nr:hypothetical protein [Deltaproteobacteria bacterium]MBW2355206.1 hypothetical protein [Deltaproteobacteria bacterium]